MRPTPPPHQHIDVNGVRIAYRAAGHGSSVMMLHGWGANSELVWPLADGLAKQGLRVIVPDLPGFGDTPPPTEAWTVHDYAALVLAMMDALNIERAHLFGHSFGGRLSIVLGAKHPARVDKVVLCDAAGVKPKASAQQQGLSALSNALKRGVSSDSWAGKLIERGREAYRQRAGSTDYLNAGPLRETFLAVIAEDLLPLAPNITRPVLLVWGDRDEDTPLWQAKALESAIPDAGLVVFKGAGHYSYLDALPDATRVIHYFYTHDD